MATPRLVGIYLIENSIDGKLYVGQAGGKRGIEGRWLHERSVLNSKNPDKKIQNKHLQRSWDKYGEDAFDFVILEIVFVELNPYSDLSFNEQTGDELTRREQHWKDTLQNAGYILYNQKGPVNTPRRGVPHTAEARAKMSLAQMGKKNHNFGKPKSPETRAKMSAAQKGRKQSEEAKAKMSEAKKGEKNHLFGKKRPEFSAKMKGRWTGEKNPMFGKKVIHSEETRAKISAALTGKKLSEETKAKISATLKGKKLSKETKDKMSKSRTKKHDDGSL